ncbi:MAG: 16S rRNA processing protein RimM [Desulfobulbus sp.]|nr:MAG: 16S rRNA processing protein RimM [Desulfobulbus sp.]RUM41027.1 MAG: 16S rRNA processing protein RimM [Desulfobulbus sp.]
MKELQDLVLLGKVTKPHGIRGEVKVYPYSGVPENVLQYSRIMLAPDEHTEPVEYTVERARVQKNCVLLQLKNCTTRNDSESLVDSLVFVESKALPKLGENEYYLRDLKGRQMVSEEGRIIGRIDGVLTVNDQDIARVVDGSREYMVPLVPDFLVSIDRDVVTVALPPGLLEINM